MIFKNEKSFSFLYLNYNILLIDCQVVRLHKDTMLLLCMLYTVDVSSVVCAWPGDYHLLKTPKPLISITVS